MPTTVPHADPIQQAIAALSAIPRWARPGLVKLCAPEGGHQHVEGDAGPVACKTPGKRPLEKGFTAAARTRYGEGGWDPQTETARIADLARWLATGKNVGWVPPLGMVVLDADSPAAADWLAGFAASDGAPFVRRAEDSAHRWYRYAVDDLGLKASQLRWEQDGDVFALDLRVGLRSQVVIAPSIHPSGERYPAPSWPEEVTDVPMLPEEIEATLRAQLGARLEAGAGAGADGGGGGAESGAAAPMPGHDKLRSYVNRWSRYLTSRDDLWTRGAAYAERVYRDRPARLAEVVGTGGELSRLVESAWRLYGGKNPLGEQKTDDAIVGAFRAHTEDGWRYSTEEKAWYQWDGVVWRPRPREAVLGALGAFSEVLFDDAAASVESLERRERLAKASAALRNAGKTESVCKRLQSTNGVWLPTEAFDPDGWIMTFRDADGVGGGSGLTVDLRTFDTWAPRREDLVTRCAAALPRLGGGGDGGEWGAFVKRTIPDEQDRAFVQEALGVSLVGEPIEHLMPFLHGAAASGKTTLLETLRAALGDYATSAPFEVICKGSDTGGPEPHLASWRGKRLVICSEIPTGARLGPRFKSLTGGDEKSVHGKYQKPFTLRPTYTLWCGGNEQPEASHTDDGVLRRLRVVPASNVVPVAERDGRLPERLRASAELGAVLGWALEGLRAYRERGNRLPEARGVVAATKAYADEQNPLHEWIEERCVRGPGELSVNEAREDFKSWVHSRYGIQEAKVTLSRVYGKHRFREAIISLGYSVVSDRLKKRHIQGLRLEDPSGRATFQQSPRLPNLND